MSGDLRYTAAALLGKPIVTVLRWQIAATAAMTLAGAMMAGGHGAASSAAGGAISIVAGLASALVASLGKGKSAGAILLSALHAEALKIGLALLLLWLVLVNYQEAAVGALLATFIVTMLIFSMAFFVRDY
jgi:ATP synthase protein I